MTSTCDDFLRSSEATAAGSFRDSYTQQIMTLDAEIEHLQAVANSILQNSLSSPLTVHAGPRLLGTMTEEEALAFVEKRLQEVRLALENVEFDGESITKIEPMINEEGVSCVEIQEELDDAGNVLNVKLNDEIYNPGSCGLSSGIGRPEASDESEESMGSIIDVSEQEKFVSVQPQEAGFTKDAVDEFDLPYIDVQEELDEDGNVIGVKFNDEVMWKSPDETEEQSSSEAKIIDVTQETQHASDTAGRDTQDDPGDDPTEQYNDLLEDMEVYKRVPVSKSLKPVDPIELMEKVDSLQISVEEKFALKGMCVETQQAGSVYKPAMTTADSLVHETNNTLEASGSHVDQQEMIELQILADEFDDAPFENAVPADEGEMDFEFESDDDDEDEDDSFADEILYGNRNVLGPSIDSHTELLFVDQVMKMREAKFAQKETEGKQQEPKKSAKSVRFSETLEIKEIENVSEDLRKAPQGRISLFKQNRAIAAFNPQTQVEFQQKHSATKDSESPHINADESIAETPLTDVVERDIDRSDFDQPISEVIERNSNSDVHSSPLPTSIARTRDSVLPESSAANSYGTDNIVVERTLRPFIPAIKSESIKSEDPINRTGMLEQSITEVEGANQLFTSPPKKLSKFKQRMAEKNIKPPQRDFQKISAPANSVMQDISEHKSDTATCFDDHAPLTGISHQLKTTSISAEHKKKDSVLKFRASRQDQPPSQSRPRPAKTDLEDEPIKEATIDFQLLQNDMDTMAKAYLLGMYDDDLGDQGTVVHSIGDFETLNRVVESMSSGDTSHVKIPKRKEACHDHHEEYDEIVPQSDDEADDSKEFHDQSYQDHDYDLNDGEENTGDSDDDAPIMRDIMEHTTSEHDDIDGEDYTLSSETLNREVSESYYRLRHKLIAENGGYRQTDAEKEFEPIVPLTTSRFKQARLSIGNNIPYE